MTGMTLVHYGLIAGALVVGYVLRHVSGKPITLPTPPPVPPAGPASPTFFQQVLAEAERLAEEELQKVITAKAAALQQVLSQIAAQQPPVITVPAAPAAK